MDAPELGPSSSDFSRPRRVFTAPAARPKTPSSRPTTPTPADSPSSDLVETLYNHSSVKIIAFSSSSRLSVGNASEEVQPGTLPASSALERTIAVGPFCIYRARGSVAFLSCGSALQPIFPKSQCWCLAEDSSRFVFQIRRPQYWRIELPVDQPDDAHNATLLKSVFDKILLFEKTECPFQRSFTVELPERPLTPVKKRPWTPVGKNLISSPFQSDLSSGSPTPKFTRERRASTLSDASPGARTQRKVEEKESEMAKQLDSHGLRRPARQLWSDLGNLPEGATVSGSDVHQTSFSGLTDVGLDADSQPRVVPQRGGSCESEPSGIELPSEPSSRLGNRSGKVNRFFGTGVPSHTATEERQGEKAGRDSASKESAGSVEPALETAENAVTPKTDTTIMPNSARATARSGGSASPRTDPSASACDGVEPSTAMAAQELSDSARSSALEGGRGARQRTRPVHLPLARRALSPLPPAANLFSPKVRQNQESRLAAVKRLPATIVHKTVEMLLRPPGHLVNLMLRVAARIVAGEWRGLVFGVDEGGEEIPVQWDYSDGEFDGWSDDDDDAYADPPRRKSSSFGISRPRPELVMSPKRAPDSDEDRSWGVD
ncbi:inheritance of peroxisomes protein 1-domain-containing protein [Xylariomycetidae sp. FL0641]|nr:inheritance of peroxisomes protein 1-domain-containing protein [Xylariomycetidae sp. FL0641]